MPRTKQTRRVTADVPRNFQMPAGGKGRRGKQAAQKMIGEDDLSVTPARGKGGMRDGVSMCWCGLVDMFGGCVLINVNLAFKDVIIC
jgi:hypothetical protein